MDAELRQLQADRKRGWLYWDHGKPYLELHALRAPVGDYKPEFQSDGAYEDYVQASIHGFEVACGVKVRQLGRSGRHICIDDTPRNRRRFASLQRKAIAGAREMWAEMRTR